MPCDEPNASCVTTFSCGRSRCTGRRRTRWGRRARRCSCPGRNARRGYRSCDRRRHSWRRWTPRWPDWSPPMPGQPLRERHWLAPLPDRPAEGGSMDDPLTSAVGDLLRTAAAQATSPAAHADLTELSARLTGPLRVAIAGKIKAGKSTLLNALVGEELAPTDAGECTRIVTWYRKGDQPQVLLCPRSGSPEVAYFSRETGALDIDLAGREPADVDRLEVSWPTSRLDEITLIDTPGIASISTDLSARTLRVLTPEDDRPPVVDAVLYLLRHTHASDVRFLES